jgi:polyisoprenoid-binding protein YceI
VHYCDNRNDKLNELFKNIFMKKVILIPLLFLLCSVSFRSAGQTVWHLDSNHSQLGFAIALLNISDVEGNFKIKDATIHAPKADFSDAGLTLRAKTKTIHTGIEARDAHLRTADFFDADKYPLITFTSKTFTKTGEGKYQVTGDLSMHGITKPVTLDATARTVVHPMTKKTVAGFRVSGVVKRSDFGISPATPPELLSNDVVIRANVQFEQQ